MGKIPGDRCYYTPEDVDLDYGRDLGNPGEYPFTRGIHPKMYRERPWTIRQYAGYGTAEETNARFKKLLEMGQTGLSVAFDLPTQNGLDPDHPLSAGEIGRAGVNVLTWRDMERVFAGIPMGEVSTSLTINAPAAVLYAMYVVAGEAQGVSRDQLEGTTQNDILKEFFARGAHGFLAPRQAVRLASDLIAYAATHTPKWNAISLSGYHIREKGSTAVMEMAFTLANANAYIKATVEKGMTVDVFAPRLSFIMNTGMNLIGEVAKYRAFRRMWAKFMRNRWGAKDERSWKFRTHTQTGGSFLQAQRPELNIARVAVQHLIAALAGVQSMAGSYLFEADSIPSEAVHGVAIGIQQIIAEETGVRLVADPLGGAWQLESLTNEYEREAWALFEKVQAMGGAVAAIESGYYDQVISAEAYQHQRAVESGEEKIVGVNFQREVASIFDVIFDRVRQECLKQGLAPEQAEKVRSAAISSVKYNAAPDDAEASAKERLAEIRANRSETVNIALFALAEAARKSEVNLLPAIIDAVRNYATVGEIMGVFRKEWGEYHPMVSI